MEFQAVLDAVRSWSVDEQVRLIDRIHEGLRPYSDDPAMTPELMEELDARLADLEANPDDFVPWEDVLAEARARHKR